MSTDLIQDAAPVGVDSLLREGREIAAWLAQGTAAQDQAGGPWYEAFARIRQARLGALRVPLLLGGAGGTVRDLATLIVTLARGDSSVAQALLPHFVFVERTLLMATEAQTVEMLGQVAEGALVGGASAELGGAFRGEDLAAAKVTLSLEHLARLDQVSAIPRSYPYTVLDDPRIKDLITGGKFDEIDIPQWPVA